MIVKGQKISDRYQIIKNVGEGGMANVYLAYDTILDREVAVKVLRGDLASDEKFVRRFQREALAASSLSNQNIVEVYDVGEDSGEYYIVMEYIEGKHLKNLLKKRGKLTVTEVVDIALQITNGLSVAHDSYLIHRDIKPQNILILDNGLVKITDFGIAVAMNATQLTQTNSVMGSVHYLPPEQAMGKTSTLQSDIYSIGIVIYELLAGKLPFTGDNAVEIALKHLKEKVPIISSVVSNVPQSIENILIKATAKNPKNRYSDAREMHDDLKTCLDEARKSETKIELKYPETDYDETKVMKIVKANEKEKKSDKTEREDEVIAKKVNPKDLKKDNKILLILASIFTGLVVIVTTIFVLIPQFVSSDIIEVPDVEGMSYSEARKTLQDAGFSVEENEILQNSKTIEEGLVIKTGPLAGEDLKVGSTVKIYVSSGNENILIEDYLGEDYDIIETKLTTLGLQVLKEYKDVPIEENADYKVDEIIDQDKEVDTELEPGEIVILYVPNLVVYPNFIGQTLDDVKKFALEHGLTLEIKEVESDEAKDIIVSQSEDADDVVDITKTFEVEISKGESSSNTGDDNQDCGTDELGNPLC